MPFDNGNLSFCVYKLEEELPENYLELFQEKAACKLEDVKDEASNGWTGRHLLERNIDKDSALIGDLVYMHFRSAVRKVPTSLMNAECMQRELALMQADNLSTLSRKKKKEIKEEVTDLLLPDMPPTLSGTPFVIDPESNMLYVGTSSIKQADSLVALLIETLNIEVIPRTPMLMSRELLGQNASIDVLDFCGKNLADDEEHILGRDFLTWIWYLVEQEGAAFTVPDVGEFEIAIDGPLALQAENIGAYESILRKGIPTQSPEAQIALQAGKKLKSAKVMLSRGDEIWSFTFDADNFVFRSTKLPDGEALDRVTKFEERAGFLHTFQESFFHLYNLFLVCMYGDDSEKNLEAIQEWLRTRSFHTLA